MLHFAELFKQNQGWTSGQAQKVDNTARPGLRSHAAGFFFFLARKIDQVGGTQEIAGEQGLATPLNVCKIHV